VGKHIRNDLGLVGNKHPHIAAASLAVLAGEAYFWYWLSRGDGFDVTGWVIADFVKALNVLNTSHLTILSSQGELLHARRFEALVFKKMLGNMSATTTIADYFRSLDALTWSSWRASG